MKKVITLVISLFASAAYGGCVINPQEYNGSMAETYGYVVDIYAEENGRRYTLDQFMLFKHWYRMEIRPVSYEIDQNGQHVIGDNVDTSLLIMVHQ